MFFLSLQPIPSSFRTLLSLLIPQINVYRRKSGFSSYHVIMKLLFTLLLSVFSFSVFAQTVIPAQPNEYAAVTALDACAGSVTVADATPFAVGMKVMLIQMQGASISEADNQFFGTVSDLGNAGNYELNTVTAVNGNEVLLQFAFINDYDPAGKVQLITVPVYEDAVVNQPSQALPWDGEKGGVYALEVTGTLTLEQDLIAAEGAGFRGGEVTEVESDCFFAFNQDNYFYEIGNWRGAPKGEGIAEFIIGKEWGRGAQANGGGGGNDHNAGGGGGSNGAAAGIGGLRSPDGAADCDGDYPGEGGRGILANSDRAFLGGGGGAGHADNPNVGSSGGNGGGIVMLKVGTLFSGPFIISAAGTTNNAIGDGAGGGGGGGTAIVFADQVIGLPEIRVTGGAGGNTVAQTGACNAPGGGGSGGRVLVNSPGDFILSINGGAAGININPVAECNGAENGATGGNNGTVNPILFITESSTEIVESMIVAQPEPEVSVCENQAFTLSVNAEGTDLMYQWQVDFGGGDGFQDMTPSPVYLGETTSNLTVLTPNQGISGALFRVVITDDCGAVLTSEITEVTVNAAPTAGFTFDNTAPFTFEFTDISEGALSVSYDFGDMSGSGEPNPVHVFAETGCYTVTQIVTGPCGTETEEQEICISQAPTAAFSSINNEGCAPLTVTFFNESAGMPTTLEWEFPGGMPSAITNDPQPTIMYPAPGQYDVILTVSNDAGTDVVTQTMTVTVLDEPTAAFDFLTEDFNVFFGNMSDEDATYLWNFGDNTSSVEQNPEHLYDAPGAYIVTLTVTNDCGSSAVSLEVTVGSIPAPSFSSTQSTGCAPFTVQFSDSSAGNPTEWFWQFPGGNPATSTEQNPTVVYNTAQTYNVSLEVTNEAGSDFILLDDYITVNNFPQPDFDIFPDLDDPFTFDFVNLTPGQVNQFIWDFDDGNTSSDFSPTHTFAQNGQYFVSLNAINTGCGANKTELIAITVSDTDDSNSLPLVTVYPSPFTDRLFVNFADIPAGAVELRLVGIDGRTHRTEFAANERGIEFATGDLPDGMYVLQILYAGEVYGVKVVKGR